MTARSSARFARADAPMPDAPWMKDVRAASDGEHPDHARRSVQRDLALAHSPPGEPPPREQRLAIDPMFMLPLRQVLDRAPRISRMPSSPSWRSEAVRERT